MKVNTLSDRGFIAFLIIIVKIPHCICKLLKLHKLEDKLYNVINNLAKDLC